jgi:hypothetical protein
MEIQWVFRKIRRSMLNNACVLDRSERDLPRSGEDWYFQSDSKAFSVSFSKKVCIGNAIGWRMEFYILIATKRVSTL